MKTIIEPRKNLALIWRPLPPAPKLYRPMKFLLMVNTEDGILLYNVVTSEI